MRCSATLQSYFVGNLKRRAWDSAIRQSRVLKAIAKTIKRYEKGEIPRLATIYFHHDDDDGQQTTKNLFLPGIIIWDPLFQHFQGKLACSKCGEILKPRSWKDGRDWKHNSPRELADIECPVLLVSRVYACKNDHRTIGHDPVILKELKLEALIPFLLLHKNGITRRLYRLLTVQTASGMAYVEVESLTRQMWYSYHSDLRIKALSQQSINATEISQLHNVSNAPQSISPLYPNRKLIRQCFVHYYYTNENLYNARMSSFTGTWLSSDHTFKVAGNVGMWQNGLWIRQYDSLFSVMNEEGIVLGWQLTRGTGFSRVKTLLTGIHKRIKNSGVNLEGFSIDNCCAWRLLLQGVFGLLPIKLDSFHAVQRIASKIKKRHPLRRQCLDAFRLVFRETGDMEKERKQPTPSREVMLKNLARFLENWKNFAFGGENVLSKQACDELEKLKVHIQKGCLENIPPKAGTSRQESMHKSLRKSVAKRRTGVKVAVASIRTCLYRWNERRLSKKNTSSSVAPITEHQDSTVICDDQEMFGIGVIQENDSVDSFGSDPELCATETESAHSSSDNWGGWPWRRWRRRPRKSERGRFLPENPRIHTVLERHR